MNSLGRTQLLPQTSSQKHRRLRPRHSRSERHFLRHLRLPASSGLRGHVGWSAPACVDTSGGQRRLAWTRQVVNTGLRGHVGWSTLACVDTSDGQLRLAWTRPMVNTGLRGHVGWSTLACVNTSGGQHWLAWTRRMVNTGLRGHVGWSTYGRLPPPFPVDCVVHSPITSSSDSTPTGDAMLP